MTDPKMQQSFFETKLAGNIGMYYCGKRIPTEGHSYGPEIRNHFLIVLVNQGSAVTCDGQNIKFGEHDLYVMFPSTKIHYRALEPWGISWVGLYGEGVSEYMNMLSLTPQNPILHISHYNELKAVMDRIFDASQRDDLSSRLHISGLICEFFSILMKNSATDRKKEFVDSALKIIDYNFCERISVEQIASRLNLDIAYFSRKFTEEVGTSPKKYILKKRIERAKELLRTTDANIFEISNSVGYDDQFYFCRIFKKNVGVAPSEYRKTLP